jgi:hypothetical protein
MERNFNIVGNGDFRKPITLRPFRAMLLSGTMLSAIALLPNAAVATNECGGLAATKNCTNLNYVPNNAGIQNGGIEYVPTGAQNPFTLNIGNGITPTAVVSQDLTGGIVLGVAVATNTPILGNGVTVANFAAGLPVGGVQTDVIVNVNQLVTINAQRDGVFVWTDGTGNDATINNSGLVVAGGIGLNAVAGNPLANPTGSGNASVTNNANASVQSVGNSINAWSESGSAIATNNGTLVSTNGSGIVIADPLTGLLPVGTTGTATNNNVIVANKSGIIVSSQGTALGTNSATGNITATTGQGIAAVSIGADGTATNDGSINAGGIGLLAGGLTTANAVNTGTVTAGGSGAIAASGDNSTVNNSGTLTANGGVGASATSVNANATATVINSGTLTSTTGLGAISTSLGAGGNALVTNSKTLNGQTGGAVALGANDATVNNSGGTITTANGTGVLATALGNNARVESSTGTVTSNDGSGIVAIAANEATVDSGAVTATNGLLGVAALGGDKGTATLYGDVNGALVGVTAASGGAGDATIQTAPDTSVTVNAQGLGLLGIGAGAGNTVIAANNITTISQGAGIVGLGLGSGSVTINAGSVTANNGGGIFGLALNNSVEINGNGQITATNGDGATGIAIGGDSNVTTNQLVTVTNGSGVTSTSIGGNAYATNNAEVSVTNGFVGVGAFSVGGNATATANGNIDPPFIGVSSFTIGSGTAHSIVNDGMSVQADGIGVFGGNIGTGTVDIDVGSNALVEATDGLNGVGIAALKLGDGNVTIDVGTGSQVIGDSFGITALAIGPSLNDNVTITNNGFITNKNFNVPVIFSITDGGTTINNNAGASIESFNGGGLAFDPIIATIGGELTVNNYGNLLGSMTALTLNGEDNVINNYDGGTWTTSGFNFLATGGNNVINNYAGGQINSVGLSVFAFADGGTSSVNNAGEFRVDGLTAFVGLEDFNNAGGRLNMQDGSINDATFTTGNFNGGAGSRLAIDSELGANSGFFLSDFLGIGGNTTPGTAVQINDTIPHQAGSYNPDGVIFALVGGTTASGDFYAANGPIDKGLFSYDVFLNPDFKGQGFDAWVIASTPDATFFELPAIVSAAQTMWHQGTGVWLDRTADLRTTLMDGCPQPASLKDPSGPCAPGLKSAVWAKGWGFSQDRDTDQSFSLHDRSFSYNIDAEQTGFGVVGGIDLVRHRETTEAGTSAWVFGVLGGYTHSDLGFHKSTTDVDFDGGTVGAYATYLNGGWFVDGKFSADLGTMDYKNSTPNLSAKDNSNFQSYGFTLDTGHRSNLGYGTFFEPGATLSYVATNIDSIKIYGSDVNFDNGDSLLGRVGIRVGTAFVNSGYRVEPFLGLSALYEFLGDNTASLTSNGYSLSADNDTKGAMGEVSGGVNLFSLDNSGTSAFAKGDFTFGEDNLIGYAGQLGVRVAW